MPVYSLASCMACIFYSIFPTSVLFRPLRSSSVAFCFSLVFEEWSEVKWRTTHTHTLRNSEIIISAITHIVLFVGVVVVRCKRDTRIIHKPIFFYPKQKQKHINESSQFKFELKMFFLFFAFFVSFVFVVRSISFYNHCWRYCHRPICFAIWH